MIISQINQVLIEELPNALNHRFEDYYLTLKEMIYGERDDEERNEKVIVYEDEKPKRQKKESPLRTKDKVLSLNLTLDSFISTLLDEWIEINELVEMYNKYFGSNVNAAGFSRLKGIKDLFEKKIERKKGKKITLYNVIA